jgi:hypothetical protein
VTSANAAPMAIPNSRSGIEISQTMGHAINASNATGQQMTQRMIQARKLSMGMAAYEF